MATREHYNTGVHLGKIRATFASGGTATITLRCSVCGQKKGPHRFHVSGGCTNLSEAEFAVYQDAKLQADPANGGDIRTAKRLLDKSKLVNAYWAR